MVSPESLLLMMMSQVCDLKPGTFVHSFGDAHIYLNHLEQVKTQLKRIPKKLPKMKLNPEINNIFDFKYKDFELIGYYPDPHIKAKVAI